MGMGGTKKKGKASETPKKLSAISVQQAGYGSTMLICYGSNRVSPILGYYTDFTAVDDGGKKGGGGGGKGGGGKSGQSVNWSYFATIILFLCEGPIQKYGKVWKDKEIYADLDATKTYSYATAGSYPNATWGYLDTHHFDQSLPYSGTAWIGAYHYELGQGATLGNHSFEIYGRCTSADTEAINHHDAHVKDVIHDFLFNAHYGAIQQAGIGGIDLDRLHHYCVARGIVISPLLEQPRPANEWLSEWAQIANCAIVWSEGIWKFVPYSDADYSGNGATFTADTAIRHHFDDDNLSEPVKPQRKKPQDCHNQVTVECLNRGNAYNKHTLDVKDQANVEQYGLRPAETLTLDSICLPRVAMIVAHTELMRDLYIRNTYTLKTFCDADLLEPLDFITITDATLGMANFRLRITGIEDEQDGNLTLTAEEAPIGVYHG